MINIEYTIVAIAVGVGWDVWKWHGGSLVLIKLCFSNWVMNT